MSYLFKFLLTNGAREYHAFVANTFADARKAANAYARLAFADGELYDYEYVA